MTSFEDTNDILMTVTSDDASPSRGGSPDKGYNKNPINLQYFTEKYIKFDNQLAREFMAELFGTFMLTSFVLGTVAQFKFTSTDNPYSTSPFSLHFGCGIGVGLGILTVGKVSGGHINPAVSFAMLLTARLNFLRFFVYIAAQTLGAFLGAALIYFVYLDALIDYKPGMYSLDAAGVFATYPSAGVTGLGAFFQQSIATMFFIIVILGITDSRNHNMSCPLCALVIGLMIVLNSIAFGYDGSNGINPARDFGPRFFTLIAGWGSQTFSAGNYFFWIPILAPFFGSLLAVLFYTSLISNQLEQV